MEGMDNSFRSGNKENVLRASENIANISLGSLNCNFGFNQSKLNVNDSYYDEDNRAADSLDSQLEGYEKKIKSLANENIALRKKNKNLIEVARLKEEELYSALEAVKKKKEEKEMKESEQYKYAICIYIWATTPTYSFGVNYCTFVAPSWTTIMNASCRLKTRKTASRRDTSRL